MSQEFFVGGGTYSQSVNNRGSKKRLLVILAAFALLVGVSIASFLFIQPKGEDVGKDLVTLMSKNNSSKSYGLLSKSTKSTISEKDWAKYVESVSKLTSRGTVTLVQKDESMKDKPLYVYSIKTEKNGIIRSKVRIVKETNKVETVTYNRTTL